MPQPFFNKYGRIRGLNKTADSSYRPFFINGFIKQIGVISQVSFEPYRAESLHKISTTA